MLFEIFHSGTNSHFTPAASILIILQLWFKNRMKRRYLEKREDEKRRERLHKEIDEWQNEKREKDLAARKVIK